MFDSHLNEVSYLPLPISLTQLSDFAKTT